MWDISASIQSMSSQVCSRKACAKWMPDHAWQDVKNSQQLFSGLHWAVCTRVWPYTPSGKCLPIAHVSHALAWRLCSVVLKPIVGIMASIGAQAPANFQAADVSPFCTWHGIAVSNSVMTSPFGGACMAYAWCAPSCNHHTWALRRFGTGWSMPLNKARCKQVTEKLSAPYSCLQIGCTCCRPMP